MIDSIRITSLTNIGANLSYNSVLPIVDINGVATTYKANVQLLGNYILSGAGGANFVRAAQSTIALSVANAAQPNITSVGNLTSLTVSGNLNVAVGNLKIPGGTNGYVLQTDGAGNLTWTAQTGNGGGGNGTPGGSNSQVQFNDAGTFGGDSGLTYNKTTDTLTTINIDAGNIDLTGNINANWVIGDYVSGNAHNLFYIPGANVNGQVGYAAVANSVAGGNVSGQVGYAAVANSVAGGNVSGQVGFAAVSNSVAVANVVGIGNIATVNKDGNASNILYGNGAFAAIPVSSYGNDNVANYLPTYTGNIGANFITNPANFTIQTDTGNANVKWVFGAGGALYWPAPPGGEWAIEPNIDSEFEIHSHTNVVISTDTANANNHFAFNTDGTFTPPTLTVDIHNGGNQNAQTLQFGDPTQQAIITGPTPAANVNAERLIIQGQRGNGTGEGGDVYFWAGDADTNGGDIKIYAGDADNVSAGYGGYINLDGGSGFDNGGQVNITGGYSANGQGGAVSVSAGQGGTDGGAININGGSATANQGGNIALQAGYGGNNGGEVRLTGGSAGVGLPGYGNVVLVSGASTWTFDNAGVLNLPGGTGTIESTANNISIYSDAGQLNGALFYDTGAEIYALQDFAIFTDNANTSHIWRFYANGNMLAPGAINVGNMVIGTVPGDITADANTGVTFNVSGSDGGFAVNYLDEVGNANTSGGELAFSSETGNATYRISLSDDLGDGFATKIWRFDGTGNLVLAGGNSVIQSIANSSLDPTNPNVSTMTLTPDANYNSQVLVLDPTAPGHIHLRAYAFSNIDEPAANIFLGGEDTAFEITSGANNEARIHSNNYTWTFGNDGAISFPRDAVGNTDPYLFMVGGPLPTITSVDVSLAGPANFQISSDYLNLTGYTGAKVAIKADNGEIATDANMVLTTNNANVGNAFSWTFGTDGSLTLPGNLVAVNASPAPVISGFSSVSALQFTNGNSNVTINANSNIWTFDSTGNLIIPNTSGGVIKTVANGAIAIAAIDNGTDNPAQLLSINANGVPTTAVSSYANEATIQANINGSIKTWAFTNAGVTTFPVLTYGNLSSATTAGRRAFISDANLAAAGNFGNAVSGGGSNTVPVYSDGSVWRIG